MNRLSSPSLLRQHAKLVAASLLAGVFASVASALMADVTGMVRGGVLAALVSVGLAISNVASRTELNTGRSPRRSTVLLWCALAGGVAGFIAFSCLWLVPVRRFVSPGRSVPDWERNSAAITALLLSLVYGVLLPWAYQLRWRFGSGQRWKTLLCVALAGWVCGGLRGLSTGRVASVGEGLVIFVLAGLFTGFPFALLWAYVVSRYDPAWSMERWRGLQATGDRFSKDEPVGEARKG